MVTIINNTIDILWLLVGLISIIVFLAMFLPWAFLCELVALTLVVIGIGIEFWLREGWKAIKKRFQKKAKWIEIDDYHLFI